MKQDNEIKDGSDFGGTTSPNNWQFGEVDLHNGVGNEEEDFQRVHLNAHGVENRVSDVTQSSHPGSDVERESEEYDMERRNERLVVIQNVETTALQDGQIIEGANIKEKNEEEQAKFERGQRHRQPSVKFKDYVMHTARCMKDPFAFLPSPSKTSGTPYPIANFVT